MFIGWDMSGKYKSDTTIKFYLSIGFAGAIHENTMTVGELFTDDKLAEMTDTEIEEALVNTLSEWAHNYIDMNWEVK